MVTTTTGLATSFITFSRPGATGGGATVTDRDGKIKWAGHNLVLNSATPATQNITTVVGAVYKVEITGAGSVALSGAGTGTASAGSPATITASTATLTLTVSGTVATMWAYRADLGGMVVNPVNSTTYYPTTSAAYYAPRLDFDGATLAARGLLVEELRGNAVTYSSDFTQWTQGGSSAVTANVVVAPDGTTTADDIERVAAESDARYTTVSFTGDGSKACSVYVKYNTSPSFLIRLRDAVASTERIFIEFTFSGGVPSAGTPTAGTVEAIENVGGGWYRIKLVASGVVAANSHQLYLYPARAGSANGQKTTFWGAQAEVQTASFSTSLIPTSGATATRAADVASVSTQAFPYSGTEGTLVWSYSAFGQAASGGRVVALGLGGSNSYGIFPIVISSTQNQIYIRDISGDAIGGTLYTANQSINKGAAAYKVNDFAVASNGSIATTSSSGAVPSQADVLRLGRAINTDGSFLNGHIRQITYLPRRISNTELQQRTL